MHEAQTPNNGAYIQNLNSIDFLQSPVGATNPFHWILAGENKANKLLLLAPASEETSLNQTVNSSSHEEVPEDINRKVEITIDSQLNQLPQLDEETNLENSSKDDWVAEPNAEEQAVVNAEFQKLLELNEELRSANNKLYEQVEELTTALRDSEAALQQQTKLSTVTESMLKQQNHELNAAQAQIQSLFEQIESTAQNVQRQESLAESYKTQFELSQQRLAQLERECALLQTKYNEESQLLLQSENACRELRTRLKRQQRQTLQFKAALEKSLETSIPGYDTLDDDDRSLTDIQNDLHFSKSSLNQSISNIQPIQPWSAPADSHNIQKELWEDIIATSASNEGDNPIEEESSSWEFSANPDILPEDAQNNQTEDSMIDQNIDRDLWDKEVAVDQIVSPSDSSELGDKLDDVIQTFFASQTESELPQPAPNQDKESSEEVIPDWKTLMESSGINNHFDTDQNSSPEQEDKMGFSSSMNENYTDETEDYWEEVSHYPAFDVSENASSFDILSNTDSHNNSPSPLIYPKRPPKGRKSFASVELPKFPQKDDPNNG